MDLREFYERLEQTLSHEPLGQSFDYVLAEPDGVRFGFHDLLVAGGGRSFLLSVTEDAAGMFEESRKRGAA